MNVLSTIAGLVGGGLNPIFGLLTSTMQSGFKAAIQFHKEGIAFARDVGLSAKQAQAYTDVLIERTQVLANRYGVSADAIMQVQRGLSEATGKQLMLNNAQAESIVQIDKLVGAQTRVKFQEEIMNGMGGQIDTANKALANVYATAAKQGLVAKKLSDKVAQNLSMANRLSFRNGIEGITRMAALSEKLGFKMQSIESAASKFLDIDKAIENAAHMQMLGGSAAVSFGNPLTAAYEANYDPEAFAKRMTDSLASYATFDKNKGIANVNGMNMDFVRQIGEQLGIGTEEATRIAKKQAEVRYKETALGGLLDRVANGDEAKRNYILNNAQVTNNGRELEINGKNINSISENEWADMMHFNGMSDTEILQEQALKLTSIDDHISGAAATVAASFAKGIDNYLPSIGEKIQKLGDFLSGYAEQWGKDTGKVIGKAMHWINNNSDWLVSTITGILDGVTKIIKFLTNDLRLLLGAYVGWKAGKWALGKMLGGGGASAGGKAASKAWNGAKWLGRGAARGAKWLGRGIARAATSGAYGLGKLGANMWNSGLIAPMKGFYSYNKSRYGGSTLKNLWGAGRQTLQSASKLTKLTMGAGVAISAIQGLSSIGEYSNKKKELQRQLNSGAISKSDYDSQLNEARIEKNKNVGGAIGTGIGTVIGTAIGGPLGGAIGGWLGNEGGKIIGEHWDSIKETAKNVWDGTKELAKNTWEGAKTLAKDAWGTISNIGTAALGSVCKVWDNITASASKGIDVVMGGMSKAYDGAKSVVKDIYGGVKTVASDIGGAIKGFFTPVATSILTNRNDVKAKPVGEKEYIYTPNGSNTSNINGNKITVNDFNINLTGTIKLDGGNNSKNIDVNALLNDYQFVSSLKELIKTSINNDMNGGRFMNDLATLRGHVSSLSPFGR